MPWSKNRVVCTFCSSVRNTKFGLSQSLGVYQELRPGSTDLEQSGTEREAVPMPRERESPKEAEPRTCLFSLHWSLSMACMTLVRLTSSRDFRPNL